MVLRSAKSRKASGGTRRDSVNNSNSSEALASKPIEEYDVKDLMSSRTGDLNLSLLDDIGGWSSPSEG